MADQVDRRFVLSCGFVATGQKHSDRALAQIALVDLKSKRMIKETVGLDGSNPTCGGRSEAQLAGKAPPAPIASCLQPLTGIALRDVETAPPFTVVIARIKRFLGPRALLVGQALRSTVALLGLAEGTDFERLCEFDDMFSYCDPFFASRSFFDLHHLAEVANLNVEQQGATADASIMVALYSQFADSYRNETEMDPNDSERDRTAIQLFRLRALQSPPSPSLAEKIGFRYDGVCLTSFPSRCTCAPGSTVQPAPVLSADVLPPALIERAVMKPRRGRSKGTEHRSSHPPPPELPTPAPAATPTKQTPPRRPSSKVTTTSTRTPTASAGPSAPAATAAPSMASGHPLSAQAAPFSPASASKVLVPPPPLFPPPPPPVPWSGMFPPAMLPGMMPLSGTVASPSPQQPQAQQLAQFFQQVHEQTLLAFQQFQRQQLAAQAPSSVPGPIPTTQTQHGFRPTGRSRAAGPSTATEGFTVSSSPSQAPEADPHSESLAQVLDFLSETPSLAPAVGGASTASQGDNAFWYPLHDSLFTPSMDDARHPRTGLGRGPEPPSSEHGPGRPQGPPSW